jgi:hypothetical protein
MEELLKQIDDYAKANGYGNLSLCIEGDESGFLIPNIYDCNDDEATFSFDTIDELKEFIKL